MKTEDNREIEVKEKPQLLVQQEEQEERVREVAEKDAPLKCDRVKKKLIRAARVKLKLCGMQYFLWTGIARVLQFRLYETR